MLREIGQRGCVHTGAGSIRSVRLGHRTETCTKTALREATGSASFQWTPPSSEERRLTAVDGLYTWLVVPSSSSIKEQKPAILGYPTWYTVWVGCPRPDQSEQSSTLVQGQAPDPRKCAKWFMGERVAGSLFLWYCELKR